MRTLQRCGVHYCIVRCQITIFSEISIVGILDVSLGGNKLDGLRAGLFCELAVNHKHNKHNNHNRK
jgi:hypothetical protein